MHEARPSRPLRVCPAPRTQLCRPSDGGPPRCGGLRDRRRRSGPLARPRASRGAARGNRAAPSERRPIGPTLSHRLGLDDIGLLLFEAAPIERVPFDSSVYRMGPARPFAGRDFRAHGAGPGRHSFARRNFSVDGRYFDLFVESGSSRPTSNRLAELNELVRSLEIEAGDFYPGRAAPARFRRAGGWVTTSSGTLRSVRAPTASPWRRRSATETASTSFHRTGRSSDCRATGSSSG